MASDYQQLRQAIESLRTEVAEGFKNMDGRVKIIELADAEEKGRRSVILTTGTMDWQKIAMSLAKSLGIGMSIAYLIAQWLIK